jgi:hypothetical protein
MKTAARISIIIVFLALIRCLSEFFRLDYLQENQLTISIIKPFVLGALVCAISCLLMTISLFYSKNRLIVIIALLTIGILFVIKARMM